MPRKQVAMARLRNSEPAAMGRAKRLRASMSDSEKLLWKALRNKAIGFKIRRQYPVGPYVLDFFVYEAKVCIEVDGELHRLRLDSDAVRDAYLLALGIETIRVPSLGVWEAKDHWIDQIYFTCCRRVGREP